MKRYLLLALPLLFSCSPAVKADPGQEPQSAPISTPGPKAPENPIEEKKTVIIAAVGDVLPHSPVRSSADRHNVVGEDGVSKNHNGYDSLFDRALPAFADADIGFANLETPVAPENNRGTRPFVFNAPPDLLDGLLFLGVRVVSYANNHAYDQGRAAFSETLDHIEARNMLAVGAGRNAEEALLPRVVEKAGMKICFMGMARLLNANLQPKSPDEPQILFVPYGKEAKEAKQRVLEKIPEIKQGCDFLLMSIHWGAEYTITPAGDDVRFAEDLLEAGVDGILGHHPHVLQPIKLHDTKDGRKTFVAYSMGNFVSNQTRVYAQSGGKSAGTRDSMVLRITVERDDNASGPKGVLAKVGFYPALTDREITPKEKGEKEPKIIRGVLIDKEIAEAKENLTLLQAKENLSKEEEDAKKAWQTRARYLEARRKEILKIVGADFVLSLMEGEVTAEKN